MKRPPVFRWRPFLSSEKIEINPAIQRFMFSSDPILFVYLPESLFRNTTIHLLPDAQNPTILRAAPDAARMVKQFSANWLYFVWRSITRAQSIPIARV
jgi:hypothetical protein